MKIIATTIIFKSFCIIMLLMTDHFLVLSILISSILYSEYYVFIKLFDRYNRQAFGIIKIKNGNKACYFFEKPITETDSLVRLRCADAENYHLFKWVSKTKYYKACEELS